LKHFLLMNHFLSSQEKLRPGLTARPPDRR
jgi:hypothetical protein